MGRAEVKWTKKKLDHEANVASTMLHTWFIPNHARPATRAFIHLFELVEPLLNKDGTVKKAALKAVEHPAKAKR